MQPSDTCSLRPCVQNKRFDNGWMGFSKSYVRTRKSLVWYLHTSHFNETALVGLFLFIIFLVIGITRGPFINVAKCQGYQSFTYNPMESCHLAAEKGNCAQLMNAIYWELRLPLQAFTSRGSWSAWRRSAYPSQHLHTEDRTCCHNVAQIECIPMRDLGSAGSD